MSQLETGKELLLLQYLSLYMAHVTNEEVRHRTGQSPVTSTIVSRRLRLFGHITRADPSQDHSRALQAAINRLPTDWRRPRRTWLRTIESDLQPTNLGLNSAWFRAQDRSKWRSVVETAICSPLGMPPDDDDECNSVSVQVVSPRRSSTDFSMH